MRFRRARKSYAMNYVICPKCGDAVAGRLPSGDEPRQLECSHCHHGFEFTDDQVVFGPVAFGDATKRWTIPRQ